MSNNKKSGLKVRHSSLEMADPEIVVKKKHDMLTKARNRLINLSEALKTSKMDGENQRRGVTQATLDYFFKHSPNQKDKNQVYANNLGVHRLVTGLALNGEKRPLNKQNSMGDYPIEIKVTDLDYDGDETGTINRSRPATVCVDKLIEGRETAALALERPRKKLSFREPEITGGYGTKRVLAKKNDKNKNLNPQPELKRSVSYCNGILHKTPSYDDFELEVHI